MSQLPGIYPSVILEILNKLSDHSELAKHLIDSARRPLRWNSPPVNLSQLPLPHPLDYDWRFTQKTLQYLHKAILAVTRPGHRISLLGAPSLFAYFCRGDCDRSLDLVDGNLSLRGRFSEMKAKGTFVACDITKDPLPRRTSHFVFVDPPWYDSITRSFLQAAAQLCKLGGIIWVSVPPIGTRPGVEAERNEQILWARQIGLTLLASESQHLNYASPPFEQNALRAQGILNVHPDWRIGDVLQFRKTSSTTIQQRMVCESEGDWVEETFKIVRLRIRVKPTDGPTGNPHLRPIIPGDILPSVSRRDPRRHQADVWTSGNRIFRCDNTQMFQKILKAIINGVNQSDFTTSLLSNEDTSNANLSSLSSTFNHIQFILRTEEDELLQALYV
jgi:hypothetical protein